MKAGQHESMNGRAGAERFARMYDRNFERIYNYVLRRTGDVSLAEDITGNVFYKALRYARRLTKAGNDPLPWLYTVAGNEVNSHLRKRRATPVDPVVMEQAVAGEPAPDDRAMRAEEEREKERLFSLVRTKLWNLDEEDQTLIALRFFEGMNYAEMAGIVGKSEGALRVRLHRAIQALRNEMEGVTNG